MNSFVEIVALDSSSTEGAESRSVNTEVEVTINTEKNSGSTVVEAGPVLLVPIIFALLALVAVSRRKKA